MSLILVSLCGLISCVSHHKHLLVHLSCHSITKTKLGPFNLQGSVGNGRVAVPLWHHAWEANAWNPSKRRLNRELLFPVGKSRVRARSNRDRRPPHPEVSPPELRLGPLYGSPTAGHMSCFVGTVRHLPLLLITMSIHRILNYFGIEGVCCIQILLMCLLNKRDYSFFCGWEDMIWIRCRTCYSMFGWMDGWLGGTISTERLVSTVRNNLCFHVMTCTQII